MPQVVLQAGPAGLAGDGPGAEAQGENILEKVERLLDGPGAGKGPEVAAAVLFEAPGNVEPGPRFPDIDLQVREGLVVLEVDVVAGVVLLDEVQLHDEGFLFRAGDVKIDIGYLGDHALQLGRELIGGFEVRPDPVVKVDGFAHVKNRPPGVPHQVNAGTVRQAVKLFDYQ